MKKMHFFVCMSFAATTLSAQIPNSGFENWIQVANDWHLTNFRQDGGEKYQPAQHGNYALKLTTQSATNTDMIMSGLNPQALKGGFPYSQQATKFIFYAKYDIQSTDKASIAVVFKKNGNVISGALTNNLFTISGTYLDEYKKFEFPITGLTQVPDTVLLFAASYDLTNEAGGTGAATPVAGSYIIYDNLSFDTSDPIPYGDFEEWGKTSLQPEGYVADVADNAYMDFANVTFPVTRTTDAHSGTYALKATTWLDPDWDNGLDQTGTPRFMLYTGNHSTRKEAKFPCTIQHGFFTGWYKYYPTSVDTAFVKVRFYKAGNEINSIEKKLYAVSVYSRFWIPVQGDAIPDSAMIDFQTSINRLKKNVGSTLYLDDIAFSTESASTDWLTYEANNTPENDGWTQTTIAANPSVYSIYALSTANNALTLASDSTRISSFTKGNILTYNTPMTVMARIKSNTKLTSRLGGYIEFDFGPSYKTTILKLKNNSSASYAGLSNLNSSGSSFVLDAAQWHVYRITFDGDSVRMYVDEDPTVRVKGAPQTTTSAKAWAFRIGSSSLANFSCGDIDWIACNYTGAYRPGEGLNPACYYNSINGVNLLAASDNRLIVTPNPASRYCCINNILKTELRITDMHGKTIMTKTVAPFEKISIDRIPAGCYFVVVDNRCAKLIVSK